MLDKSKSVAVYAEPGSVVRIAATEIDVLSLEMIAWIRATTNERRERLVRLNGLDRLDELDWLAEQRTRSLGR